MTSLQYLNFLLASKTFSHHIFSLNLEVTIFLMLLIFCNAIVSAISQWFNQALVSLYQPHLSFRWFWMEFKAILGSLWSPMLLILCLYNRILVIARLSIGERPTSIRRISQGVLLLILRLYVIKRYCIYTRFIQDSLQMLQPHISHPYKITGVTKVSNRSFFYPTSQGLLLYNYFQDQNKLSTLH